jgi:uncharacterized repeat protein (TIGR01451 family)
MTLPGKLARFATAFISMVSLAACAGDATAPSSTAAGVAASFAGGATGPDLQISGSASTGSPNAGATFSYTFQIRNSGSTMATSVSFVDTLPAGTGFLGAGATGYPNACSVSNMILTCDLQGITKGSQINVMVTLNAPVTAGSFVNTARLTEAEVDAQPANNVASVTVQVKTALAACTVPAGQSTTDGMIMFGVFGQFSAYEQFEYQVSGVNYWVVTNYFDGTQPLTSVINLDCKTSPAQFVQVGNFVNVTGVVDGTILLPGQTTEIPVLHASVIQVLTHKDKA